MRVTVAVTVFHSATGAYLRRVFMSVHHIETLYHNWALPPTDLVQKGIPKFAQKPGLFVELIVPGMLGILGSRKRRICPGRDHEKLIFLQMLNHSCNRLTSIQAGILGSPMLLARPALIWMRDRLANTVLGELTFFETIKHVSGPQNGLAHVSIVVKC